MQSQSPYFHSPILLAMCSLQFTWGGSRMQWWLSEACIDFSTDGGRSFISCTVWWDEDISHFADPFPAGNCLYLYWVLNSASSPHFPFLFELVIIRGNTLERGNLRLTTKIMLICNNICSYIFCKLDILGPKDIDIFLYQKDILYLLRDVLRIC